MRRPQLYIQKGETISRRERKEWQVRRHTRSTRTPTPTPSTHRRNRLSDQDDQDDTHNNR
jgi:hypothetical protein